ncbi:hypothetical protein ACFLUB_02710 [Chloroflexota bacterium]
MVFFIREEAIHVGFSHSPEFLLCSLAFFPDLLDVVFEADDRQDFLKPLRTEFDSFYQFRDLLVNNGAGD